MKRLIVTAFIFIMFSILSQAQVYNGDLTLKTQSEIDTFSYTEVTGNLTIQEDQVGTILNLDGLSELSTIGGNLNIFQNSNLDNITGLSGLQSVYGIVIGNNNLLSDINGLQGIDSILFISLSGSIQNLSGLSNLSYIGLNLTISAPFLTTLDGLNSLKYVGSELNLTSAGSLINVDGLENLEYIGGFLWVEGCRFLDNLDGLSKLEYVPTIVIENNSSLRNINGLSLLKKAGFISIGRNRSLKNIDGLSGIDSLHSLIISDNSNLENVNGLSNLAILSSQLSITENTKLFEFCGLYTLLKNGFPGESYTLNSNGSNPSLEEIIAGGPCSADRRKSFIAVLLGKHETPPVITDGSGGGMFVLNAARDTLEYWIRLCELKCPFTSAHLHLGAPGYSGPIVKTITNDFVIYPGSNDGYAHGIWTSSDAEPLTKVLARVLISGNIYVNVHTTGYPSGEIRGQLTSDIPAHLFANLVGSQEVPPVDTAGSGEAWFTLSGDGDSLYYNVTAYDLTSPVTAAHFHKAPVDSAGPPVKPISFMGDTLSEGWWTNMDATPLTPELVADLLGCYIYVNVHTSNNPNGEIRGQLYKTEEVPTSFMTLLAAENDADENNYSKLSYYTLQEGKPFHNYEGEITGYDAQKNIVDMTIDIGGNVYFLNNSWTSMLYRIRPEQFDFDAGTVLRAKQMGRLRTSPDDKYVWMTNIQFIKGKLYGFDSRTNKLYNINPNNAHVTEIAEISSPGKGIAGFAPGADGEVYLLKNIDEKRSEIWKFNKFPSTELTLVTEVPSLGRLNTLSAHPNGNLYSTCNENLYEINLTNKTIGVLKDHKITASAMDFDYFTEKQTASAGTIPFTNLDGTTAVGNFTEMPTKYELSQNYPNPFNPNTTIKYALPEAAFVKLVVYNSLGEVVKTLVNGDKSAGYYETVFDAKDLSSGMYIYRLEAGSFVSIAKMILLK